MSLEKKSQELKDIVSTYETEWFLGDLSGLMMNIASGRAQDQLGKLSSPMRQLYFLGGLLITSEGSNGKDIQYSPEKWNEIIRLLNEIENEYSKLFFPNKNEKIDEEWKKIRKVAMPSFLSYFNQGPLNYEEQSINWITELYTTLDDVIETSTDLKTIDFINFYENLDALHQRNFQSFSPKGKLKENWKDYTKLEMVNTAPPELGFTPPESTWAMYHFVADQGMINRFYSKELISDNLSIEKIEKILLLLSCSRAENDFLYYTSTKPGNPLYDKPILKADKDLYQVFEVKQVLHSIDNLLETICSNNKNDTTKLTKTKGDLLEKKIVSIFSKFLKSDFEIYTSYYIDNCEQDILILWKNHAFIIEAKGYNLREPLRDPNRAFVRIKDDFKSCIGYGYKQTKRVEDKFLNEKPFEIFDKNGNPIAEINPKDFGDNYYSIIVNINSFGQIQTDLSTLLDITDDDIYPWVVKLDDLEVFLLTLLKKKKTPKYLVNFLLLREELHGKLICSDELEICGGYLINKLNEKFVEKYDTIVTTPDLPEIFDEQYRKEIGFENEKYLKEKRSGKYIFW
tara:strand:+ start:38 stop:1744 length:1707 start_codon:yes stop_codon:yes gene_type:complete